ncbi:MAG: Nif3-like dinuclear metal center hexameric protein [Candidatus Thorarchaeota archaeon]
MTTLHDIVKYFNEIAPKQFTFRGQKSYVEVGGQTEHEQLNETVNKIIVSTYPSSKAVTKATQDKANLLVTHWPLFYEGLDRLSGSELRRVRLLVKNYISVYVLGSALTYSRGGLTDALTEVLGLTRTGDLMRPGDFSEAVPAGRLCQPPEVMNHSRFANYVSEKLSIGSIVFTGGLDDELQVILVFPGSNLTSEDLNLARQHNVGTVVTGELCPSVRLLAHELGIGTLELGPFTTEEPGMKRLRHQMSLEFPSLKIDFVETPQYANHLKF